MRQSPFGTSTIHACIALATICISGCAYTVVRPDPLVVGSAEAGNLHVVHYPTYVLVHDSESDWDAHQIKDNLFGLTEGEVVHWADLSLDAVTPGPPHRPLENGIEGIKNGYAQLPDCAPVRIVDGFFSALGIEKLTVVGGASRAAMAPTDPVSYFTLTRFVYLTDWAQDTLGEVNTGLGYITPWDGAFVPHAVTRPINAGVDWAQYGIVTLYIRIFRKVNAGIDCVIDSGESAWGGVVWTALWCTNSLDESIDHGVAKEKDVGRMPGPGAKSK